MCMSRPRADSDIVVRKGANKGVDSYSGFGDAFEGKWEKTELEEVLKKAGITDGSADCLNETPEEKR